LGYGSGDRFDWAARSAKRKSDDANKTVKGTE